MKRSEYRSIGTFMNWKTEIRNCRELNCCKKKVDSWVRKEKKYGRALRWEVGWKYGALKINLSWINFLTISSISSIKNWNEVHVHTSALSITSWIHFFPHKHIIPSESKFWGSFQTFDSLLACQHKQFSHSSIYCLTLIEFNRLWNCQSWLSWLCSYIETSRKLQNIAFRFTLT